MRVEHSIDPVYDENSKILILGSFPSVKSREYGFFYGHPQNRFWKVISAVFEKDKPITIEEKKAFLIDNGIALWDVIESCEITGSSDSSIKNAVPNNLDEILNKASIRKIFTNGRKSEELYKKYLESKTRIACVCLPSTSPANAAWSADRLTEYWAEEIKHMCR